MDYKSETEKLEESVEPGAEPEEELNDIQWLKAKYRLVLDREKTLIDYLIKILGNFEYRIKILEKKLEKG